MTTAVEPTTVDEQKLMAFVFRAVDEVGAAPNATLVVMGDKLHPDDSVSIHRHRHPQRTAKKGLDTRGYSLGQLY